MAEKNVLSGILAIILGLLVMAFPMFSVFTLSVLTGFGIIFIGIWLIFMGMAAWSTNKGISIASLLLGIIGLIVGIGLFGKILAFSVLVGMVIYIGGFFLIIAGIIALISGQGSAGRWGGLSGIILGVLYLIIGMYALNPLYLAFLIGIFLIINGIFQILMPEPEPELE